MTKEGVLNTLNTPLHLLHSNVETIVMEATGAWMQNVSDSLLTRKGLRNTPKINPRITCQLFAKVPEEKQRTIGLDITMGYMLNSQKAHFDPNQPMECELCGDLDTYTHRVLECPATSACRFRFPKVCEYLEEHDTILHRLPVKFADQELDLLHTIMFNFPEPVPASLPYKPAYLFTDGACSKATDVEHRWASYAILATEMDLRKLSLNELRNTEWLLHNVFDTISVSHVTGPQNVPRAELQAAVLAQELQFQVPVVTDSKYVVDTHHLVEITEDVRSLHKRKSYDLIKRLHAVFWTHDKTIPVKKVKAHQQLLELTHDCVLIVGNAVADLAAVKAQHTLAKPVTQELTRLAEESKYHTDLLAEQYEMRSALAEMRKRLQAENVTVIPLPPKEAKLISWTVDPYQCFSISDTDFQVAHASRWGTVFTVLLMDWLQSLKWPRNPERTKPAIGITWFELTVNFMVVCQRTVPINTAPTGQPARYTCVEEDDTFDNQSFAFGNATSSFRDAIAHVAYLLQQEVMPPMTPQKVKSLRFLGSTQNKQGIPYRPEMLGQDITLQVIKEYCDQTGSYTEFSNWPQIPELEPRIQARFQALPGDTPAAKMSRYHKRRREIRQARQLS